MEKIRTVCVCGPTASGKTALGVALAEKLHGEVISADSMQIYKFVDIASAKPTPDEMRGIRHHLIDFVDPSENYSVAQYTLDANKAADEIVGRGKMPIIVGGTGLYIECFINNITLLDDGFDEDIRSMLRSRIESEGSEKLYNELVSIDPAAAAKIHPNNFVKLLRALEVYYSSGMTLTKQNELSKQHPSRFDNTTVFLNCKNRDYLYRRIESRVDRMLEAGLVEEAKRYYSLGCSSTSSQAIGYKELKPFLDGVASLDECVDNLKKATRNYAKRQLTWFRRNKDAKEFFIDEYSSLEDLTEEVLKAL